MFGVIRFLFFWCLVLDILVLHFEGWALRFQTLAALFIFEFCVFCFRVLRVSVSGFACFVFDVLSA